MTLMGSVLGTCEQTCLISYV